jgi:probable rRNA maturation factor
LVIFRKKVAGASVAALTRFIQRARQAAGFRGRVSVLVTSSRELRSLNRRFRGKDCATDVLSFSSAPLPHDTVEGDIAISAQIASRNAACFGHKPADELKILILHGILHLAGYDHEHDRGEMARQEARLRRELRLPDALIERAHGGNRSSQPPARSAHNEKRRTNNPQPATGSKCQPQLRTRRSAGGSL